MVDELEPFVDRRLLSTEAEGERTVVGVAHEAFLVNWPPLKDEIDAQADRPAGAPRGGERGNGLGRQRPRRRGAAARRQTRQGNGRHRRGAGTGRRDNGGGQTVWAEAAVRAYPGWWSRQRRLVTRVELNDTGREFLEASMRTDRSRRRRRITQVISVGALLVSIIVAVIAAVPPWLGFVQATTPSTKRRPAPGRRPRLGSSTEAADMLAQNEAAATSKRFRNCLPPTPSTRTSPLVGCSTP